MSLIAADLFTNKSHILLNSKYSPHVIFALTLNLNILNEHYKDIINIKMHSGNGVDLAREERIKKYEGIINRFKEIY